MKLSNALFLIALFGILAVFPFACGTEDDDENDGNGTDSEDDTGATDTDTDSESDSTSESDDGPDGDDCPLTSSCIQALGSGTCTKSPEGACVIFMSSDTTTMRVEYANGVDMESECQTNGTCTIKQYESGELCDEYAVDVSTTGTIVYEKDGQTWTVVTDDDTMDIDCPDGSHETYDYDTVTANCAGYDDSTEQECEYGCEVDGDCFLPGDVCDNGICVAGDTCEVDDDCPSGQICITGTCIDAGSECTDDTDCDDGEICQSGVCITDVTTPECEDDTDCDDGDTCVLGVCLLDGITTCEAHDDCPWGALCVAGYCIDVGQTECTDDGDCDNDNVCTNGVCTEQLECTDSSGCEAWETCETTFGMCVPKTCESDDDCGGGTCLISVCMAP